MMKKYGVNSTRQEKRVAVGPSCPRAEKVIKCPKCGRLLKKSCPSKEACDSSVLECPGCGELVG